jgi:predicted O-methyltransferase YrrM
MQNFNYEEFIAPYKKHVDPVQHASKRLFFDSIIPYLVSLDKELTIVETGSMHLPLDWNAGAMTLLFGDLIKNWTGGKLITIDISPESTAKCKELTAEFSDVIEYVTADSVSFLTRLEEKNKVDLFFFDSYDLNVFDPAPSYIHHFRELLAVYDDISENAIVSIDDNFLPQTTVYWNFASGETAEFDTKDQIVGKGTLIERFLRDQGWKKLSTDVPGMTNIFTFTKTRI